MRGDSTHILLSTQSPPSPFPLGDFLARVQFRLSRFRSTKNRSPGTKAERNEPSLDAQEFSISKLFPTNFGYFFPLSFLFSIALEARILDARIINNTQYVPEEKIVFSGKRARDEYRIVYLK